MSLPALQLGSSPIAAVLEVPRQSPTRNDNRQACRIAAWGRVCLRVLNRGHKSPAGAQFVARSRALSKTHIRDGLNGGLTLSGGHTGILDTR